MRAALRRAPGDWYVVHSYAGYENRVKTNLETRTSSLNMEDYIFQVEVPQREEIGQIKNGQRKMVKQNLLPGYVLVRMDLTDESWGAVRNTPGVTGFVGHTHRPSPLTLDEVMKILAPEQEKKAEGRRDQGRRLRGRRVGHRHGRPVRDAAGVDQRDQRRLAEAQGARRRSSAARPRSSSRSARCRRSDATRRTA